jgi:pyruvate dehydrogenase phosphatase
MSADVIRTALFFFFFFLATEEGFLSLVTKAWPTKPQLAAVGSCCLVGVVCGEVLYVANLGDSRAVLGRLVKSTGEIAAMQLSTEHNADIEAVRQELQSLHPDDPRIVVLKHGVWRVKGIIQVSRSIGDVYLKRPEFNREPVYQEFRLSEPLRGLILTAEPSINVHTLQPHDQFIIFASDGLWEYLSNQEAVDIFTITHMREMQEGLLKLLSKRQQRNGRCAIQISRRLIAESDDIFMMILLSLLCS